MNPTDNSLPPLPNLDLTIAPKDDLLVLPQDQTTSTNKPDQSVQTTQVNQVTPVAQEARENSDPNFSVPTGWGAATQVPKIDIPEYPDPEDHPQSTNKDTVLTRFVKIFLVAVALILLGVLLGVLASNFLSSPKPTTSTNVSIPSQPEAKNLTESPTATEVAKVSPAGETEYNKKIEYRNIGSGPYSFDLLLSDDWKIASKSTEPKNLNIDIENQDLFAQITYNSKQNTPKSSLCLLPEEIAPKNIPYIKYQQIDELKMDKFSWKLVKSLTATQSASYLVCEQNKNNQYTNLTSVGFINFGLTTDKEISANHKDTILKFFKGLKIINSATSSAVKK